MWAHGWRTSTESVVAKHNGVVEACGIGARGICDGGQDVN